MAEITDSSEAIAAWTRFDEEISDALLRAVSGAFAAVACADGVLDEKEVDMFLDMVRDSNAFTRVDLAALEQHFRNLATAILGDFEAGRKRALEEIAAARGNDKHTALVVSAAQIAIVADEKLRAREEVALRQICEVLGLDPALY
ncbi:MAG: TerB family tellurite resistance protein [Myxococcota bacterium]